MNDSWMTKEGPQDDIVLGTRIRLARNLAKIPFPAIANAQQGKVVVEKGKALVEHFNDVARVNFYELAEVDQLDRKQMMERHLISPEQTENTRNKCVIISEQEDISIMINEEDHFRIQILIPGLQLEVAWEKANQIDNLMESHLEYAFDPDIGYLTACPTNVGTGMRGSLMLHLPALAKINQLARVLNSASQFGLVVRGLYGEGSKSYGNIFQISNQVSLGHTEEDMLKHLLKVAEQIVVSEKQARQYLLEDSNRTKSEDQIYRAYGILANARIISTKEALELLSAVLLGIDLGLILDVNRNLIKGLMLGIRSAHLQKTMGQSLPPSERQRLRASLIRDKLSINIGKDV